MLGCGNDCGCGCNSEASFVIPPTNFGGFFSTLLNVGGSFIGDPELGSQIASQAVPGFAPVTQDAKAIADTVTPDLLMVLKSPVDIKGLSPRDQQVASSAGPAIAMALAAKGYVFAPGTVGAELQKPSAFDAFGGNSSGLVKIGFGVLGVALLIKMLRG